MIENLFGGGGGGGLQGVTAGTGISVDNTNPDNPIITNTSLNTDEVAKVSSNDTTAGYLNGKLVAGSGISLTENNNGGNETLGIAVSNLDAGAITTGTIATARLGTGTANSSTYLAGDQTYKAAVTSVNGATGAVTVAGGDTTYSMTIADAENTTTKIDLVAFTIPANALDDGNIVELNWWFEMKNFPNNSSPTFTAEMVVNSSVINSSAYTVGANSTRYRLMKMWFWRRGSNLFVPRLNVGGVNAYDPSSTSDLWQNTNAAVNESNYSSLSPSFTSNISVIIKGQWSAANAASWLRTYNARCVKVTGQQT